MLNLWRTLRPGSRSMRQPDWDVDSTHQPATLVIISAGLCVAITVLVFLGYVATREWRRGATLILERRQAEALAWASEALNRDMKGAWATVLAPVNRFTLDEEPPYDIIQLTAKAFARFPYPESFLIYKNDGSTKTMFALNRTDRTPQWEQGTPGSDPFPVVLERNPPELAQIAEMLAALPPDRPFVSLDADINGVPYQVVAHAFFASAPPHRVSTAFAFTVNMNWVRQEYFRPLVEQVAQIGRNERDLSLAVADEHGRFVGASGPADEADRNVLARQFPLVFLEPALLPRLPVRQPTRWTLSVRPRPENGIASTRTVTLWLFAVMVPAAIVSLVALLLTTRAARANARVASMKSDFVAAVTHDLKTPVALIQLVGETLARGRYTSSETIGEYAQLLSQEASRLGHSIDSLLTYSRYTDPRGGTPLQLAPIDLNDVVEEALEEFRPVLTKYGFELTVDIPPTLPAVSLDRRAMIQVFASVIDNAIKYSTSVRALSVTGSREKSSVRVRFADQGSGIPEQDIEHVFERFYRGRNAKQGGSGLGLTIAQRIIEHHKGKIAIRSTVDLGTTVDVSLPVAG